MNIITMLFVHDKLGPFWIWNQYICIMEECTWEGLLLLALVTAGR